MNKFLFNSFNTTDLTLNTMELCARVLGLDINDNDVSSRLYQICCDLESWPENEGFGSSDSYSYIQHARKEFNIDEAA